MGNQLNVHPPMQGELRVRERLGSVTPVVLTWPIGIDCSYRFARFRRARLWKLRHLLHNTFKISFAPVGSSDFSQDLPNIS